VVLAPEAIARSKPIEAIEPCTELPTLPDNFLTLPKNDAVKTLLMTKVRSDEIYRDCAARHKALADWIMEDEVSP
jgi:hypothetical protein